MGWKLEFYENTLIATQAETSFDKLCMSTCIASFLSGKISKFRRKITKSICFLLSTWTFSTLLAWNILEISTQIL